MGFQYVLAYFRLNEVAAERSAAAFATRQYAREHHVHPPDAPDATVARAVRPAFSTRSWSMEHGRQRKTWNNFSFSVQGIYR